MSLQLDKAMTEKGRSLSHTTDREENVKLLLQDSVKTGKIGRLSVDPAYFVYETESCK